MTVRVRPRSSRPGVEVGASGEVTVRVRAAAVEGAANREMMEALARALRVAKTSVRIIHGERSRGKRVEVEGVSAAEAAARLGGAGRGVRDRADGEGVTRGGR